MRNRVIWVAKLSVHSSCSEGDFDELPPSLHLGIEGLDCQHLQLIRQLNAFRSWRELPLNSEQIGELAHLMGTKLLHHFKTEEAFMSQTAMPKGELEDHQKEHDRIIDAYVELLEMIQSRPLMKAGGILVAIENWITTHIQEYDLQIRNYL